MKNRTSLLFALLVWSLLILRFGYRFGTGDQVELLPYVLFLHDQSLYAHDFFIQGLHSSVPNERTVMANLLLPFVNHLEIACFILHLLSTVFLVYGLEKLALRFVQNKYAAWLAILVALIPLNDYNLGNLEMYSECFQASLLSVSIVVWGIFFFLEEKYWKSALLMSAATFIQLLDGLDVMLVLSGVLFLRLVAKQIQPKTFFAFISIYGITAGIYLALILQQKTSVEGISDVHLFSILFEFRHPHHFIFSTFPKIKTAVFCLFALLALIFFFKKEKTIFRFLLIAVIGIAVYAVAVDVLHNIPVANFQFYKVTPWVKFLGVVAVFAYAEKKIRFFSENILHLKFEKHLLALSTVLCWAVIVFFNQYLPYKVPFQIFGMKEKDDMISICKDINEVTPSDAVFIQPFENTELKFFAQRSSYVEFKANVRNKKFVGDWYDRIQLVFDVSAENTEKGFALQQKANENYYTENRWVLSSRAGQGISYMLVKKNYAPPFGTKILENNSYAVYQL